MAHLISGARPEMFKGVGLHKTQWAKRRLEYENCTPNYQQVSSFKNSKNQQPIKTTL